MESLTRRSGRKEGAQNRSSARISVFEYPGCVDAPALPLWDGFAGADESFPATAKPLEDTGVARGEAALRAEFDRKLAEEVRRAFETGRERGRVEGRQAEHEMQSAAEIERKQQVADLVEDFAEERDRYLRDVEHEVVELALAIAARILRREAQMDPLLLTGAVRVALGQLAASTQVRLRVPSAELALWAEAVNLIPNLALRPTVIAGERMRLGDCILETELGTVDLGLRAQLAEIERGFFDSAGNRSAGFSAASKGVPADTAEILA